MNKNVITVDLSLLKKIRALELFSDEQIRKLSDALMIEQAAPKQRIISVGDSGDYSLYIVSGEAKSTTADGTQREVISEVDNELQPIAQLRPSLYNIEAVTELKYVKLFQHQLTGLSQHPDDDITVMTYDQGEVANRLTMRLCQDIMDGSVKLPHLPEIVLKLQQALSKQNCDANMIQKLIQSDPAIAAKLLKYANSALYQGSAPAENLHQVIVRLGMETVQQQVTIIATSKLFLEKSRGMKTRMQKLWKNSRRVAAFCRVLAKKSGAFEAEAAQMAGLLSDLGVIAILQYAQEHSELYENEDSLDRTVELLRPQINGMLMQKWNLGSELVAVGEDSRNWFRNHGNDADLCDLVLIARYHSYLGSGRTEELPLLAKLPAFFKLEMSNFSPADSIQFLKESQEQVALIEQMLGGI